MKILAIDPGSKESAWLLFDSEGGIINDYGFLENDLILKKIDQEIPLGIAPFRDNTVLAIESLEGFGMTAGQEIFDTCWWSGRFCQAFRGPFRRLGRKAIKINICGHSTAKDKDIREALIHRFGDPGKKSAPGKLYGIAGHCWSALAVAVTFSDIYASEEKLSIQK